MVIVEGTWMFTDLYPVLDRKALGISSIMTIADPDQSTHFLTLSLTQMGMELSTYPRMDLICTRLASKVSENQDC